MVRAGVVAALLAALAACAPPAPGTCSSPRIPHRTSCADPCCGDGNNPPTSGGHCATPLGCHIYSSEQPRCQWVHNLEHGHVVLLFNCPGGSSGCPTEYAALEAIWNARPLGSNGVRRAVLAPDSFIPAVAAVVVWGHSWVGDVIDQTAIDEVLSHQDEAAVPEQGLLCGP